MAVLALAEIETMQTAAPRHGITAVELLDHRAESRRWISASALEAWLVESGFAETNGVPGHLVLTTLGREVGGAIEFLGSWSRS